MKKLFTILLLFTSLYSIGFAQEQIKAKSAKMNIRVAKIPKITISFPTVPKGTVYYHDGNKITIKGNIRATDLMMFSVDKTETTIAANGDFTQEVKIKYDQNTIVLKAIDKKNHIVNDTILINRPFAANTDTMNNAYGKNYALLIGTDKYNSMTHLSNPVLDAKTISAELSDNYGFITDTVINPSMNGIYTALRKYSSMQFSDDDQLLIFIAGHGEFDDIFKDGYIVPSDALKNDQNKSSYISHSNLRTIINNIPCKHIFLVMDVCFGGTFDQAVASRGIEGDENTLDRAKFIKRKLKNKTRLYLTSGGKVYVPDGRAGHHSPFARKFIEALRHYGGEDKIITFTEILGYVEKAIPEPTHGEFGNNAPGSDFLLLAK